MTRTENNKNEARPTSRAFPFLDHELTLQLLLREWAGFLGTDLFAREINSVPGGTVEAFRGWLEGASKPDADQALALLDGLIRMKEIDADRRRSREEFEEQTRLATFFPPAFSLDVLGEFDFFRDRFQLTDEEFKSVPHADLLPVSRKPEDLDAFHSALRERLADPDVVYWPVRISDADQHPVAILEASYASWVSREAQERLLAGTTQLYWSRLAGHSLSNVSWFAVHRRGKEKWKGEIEWKPGVARYSPPNTGGISVAFHSGRPNRIDWGVRTFRSIAKELKPYRWLEPHCCFYNDNILVEVVHGEDSLWIRGNFSQLREIRTTSINQWGVGIGLDFSLPLNETGRRLHLDVIRLIRIFSDWAAGTSIPELERHPLNYLLDVFA